MSYGYFDDPNREYVITNPRTPAKWINYIGTLQFGGFVDHTGGALICKQDPPFNRITKYVQQIPSSDFKGETLYLRVRAEQSASAVEAQGYKIFSPFFVPTLTPYDKYECRVGLGYTCIVSEMHGLRTEVTIFVPTGAAVEVRDIKVTNISDMPLEVDAIPVLEYTHPNALQQFTNADWIPQTMQSRMLNDGEFTVLIQYPFMFRDIKVNYFTSNLPASSFETDRKKFLGENEYGTWAKPVSLQGAELTNTQANRGANIASVHPRRRYTAARRRRTGHAGCAPAMPAIAHLWGLTAPLFLLVLTGYALSRWGRWPAAATDALTRFVFAVAVPAFLFRLMSDFSRMPPVDARLLIAFFGGCLIVFLVGRILARHLFALDGVGQSVFAIGGVFSNNVLLGVPIAKITLGDPAMPTVSLIVVFNALVLWTLVTLSVEWARTGHASLRGIAQTAWKVVRNPVVAGILGGTACGWAGVTLPGVVDRTLQLIGEAAVPAVPEHLGRAAGRQDLDAQLGQALREIKDPFLVRDADERAGDLDHGGYLRGTKGWERRLKL